ncbi:MAG: CDP-alcohol phosphatidyltransferase family protein [Candidatus Xenobia bacterium]
MLDRRPIASRRLPVFQSAASWLARRQVSPDVISLSSIAAAALAAWALLSGHWWLAALGVQGRLLANLLDGMVAVEGGTASRRGELFNDVPDRISDTLILVAFGTAAGSVVLGLVAALAALGTAYVRVLEKALGLGYDFGGPMAKPHRMALVTVVCVIGVPALLTPALWLLIGGSVLTMVRRLRHIRGQL